MPEIGRRRRAGQLNADNNGQLRNRYESQSLSLEGSMRLNKQLLQAMYYTHSFSLVAQAY